MPLTAKSVENAKPRTAKYKLADGEGMYLYVWPNGSKYWRLKYRFNGKEKTLALGKLPEVSLQDARKKRFEARQQISSGIPDVIERQLAHAEKNEIRASYNQAEYLEQRVEMMQWWGNFLAKQGLSHV